MATLIRAKTIVTDNWRLLDSAAGGALTGVLPRGDWIVPLAQWAGQRTGQRQHEGRLGVLLESTDDPHALVGDFDRLALIAVHFPKFTDGRGYSAARLLRRLGWKRELRAVGDVLRDQLFYMARCGFDAFVLRVDQEADVALGAFGDFSVTYQPAVDAGARFGGVRGSGGPREHPFSPW